MDEPRIERVVPPRADFMRLQCKLPHVLLRDLATLWVDPVVKAGIYLQARSRGRPSDESQHGLKIAERPTSPVYADMAE